MFYIHGLGFSRAFQPTRSVWCSAYRASVCPKRFGLQGVTGVLNTWPWFVPSFLAYKECLMFCVHILGSSPAFRPTRSDWCSVYTALVRPNPFGLKGVSGVLYTWLWFVPFLSAYKECLVFCTHGLGLSPAFRPTRSVWCSVYMALVCPLPFSLQEVTGVLYTRP